MFRNKHFLVRKISASLLCRVKPGLVLRALRAGKGQGGAEGWVVVTRIEDTSAGWCPVNSECWGDACFHLSYYTGKSRVAKYIGRGRTCK